MEALLPVAPWLLVVILAVVTLAAAVQGTIGFGFGVVSVPLMSLLDPALAPVPQLLCSWPLALLVFYRERQAADLRGIRWVILGSLPGTALGMLLLRVADARVLDLLLGSMVLTAVVILATGRRIARRTPTEVGAGVVSGTFGIVSGMSGPPLALLYRDAEGPVVRSSLTAYFSFGVATSLIGRGATGRIALADLHLAAFMLPAVLLGLWASRYAKGKVEGRPLRVGILIVAALSAVGVLARAAGVGP